MTRVDCFLAKFLERMLERQLLMVFVPLKSKLRCLVSSVVVFRLSFASVEHTCLVIIDLSLNSSCEFVVVHRLEHLIAVLRDTWLRG